MSCPLRWSIAFPLLANITLSMLDAYFRRSGRADSEVHLG